MDILTNSDSAQSSSDRLELLFRLSQTFSSSLDLDEVLSVVRSHQINPSPKESHLWKSA